MQYIELATGASIVVLRQRMEHVVEVATKVVLGVKLGRASPHTIHHKLELLLAEKDKKSHAR